MRARWERMARIFVASACAGALWSAGADFSTLPQVWAQSVFQSYNKPQAVPDFSVQDLQGKRVDMGDLRGQIVLLNFWATWCPNCRQEGPSLQGLFDGYKSRSLSIYRIASKETPDTIRQFLEKESLNMPVLIDGTGRTERLFGVWVHPTTYLINRKSQVCYRIMGAMDWQNPQATNLIDHLLNGR